MNTVDFIRFFAFLIIAQTVETVIVERSPDSWVGRSIGTISGGRR